MNEKTVTSAMSAFLHEAVRALVTWLGTYLPKVRLVGKDTWWDALVKDCLNPKQMEIVATLGAESLQNLDLPSLLWVAEKNWSRLCSVRYWKEEGRTILRKTREVRNRWAHCPRVLPPKEQIAEDLQCLERLFCFLEVQPTPVKRIQEMRAAVLSKEDALQRVEIVRASLSKGKVEAPARTSAVTKDAIVRLVADPSRRGVVTMITGEGEGRSYQVFIDGEVRQFFEGQIEPIPSVGQEWLDEEAFRAKLSAFQIRQPESERLYSLNAARVDFVPYQFRPTLKLLKADAPRLLIADSVGVGKTIEAGLILKELEAREPLRNVLIFCPKPLVSERKWELEMRDKFDERFTPMNGAMLRQAFEDVDRDGGVWPEGYSRAIIPYSILDGALYEGKGRGKMKNPWCIENQRFAPHFDLIIIDEAHNLRTGSVKKEKAFAYKCIRWFCEHAKAVVMLTATPLQMGDHDLFVLLNLLRPDVMVDEDTFRMMQAPNEAVSTCAHVLRAGGEGWQAEALHALEEVVSTEWGERVIGLNPRFAEIRKQLMGVPLSREARIRLIGEVEALNSFSSLISRTRRRDIEDFCVRLPQTVEIAFTPAQQAFYDRLLEFQTTGLVAQHGAGGVAFMLSTIRRQAASCLYGLVPYIDDFVNHRITQVVCDGQDLDEEELEKRVKASDGVLKALADALKEAAAALPKEDPKFDQVLKIIQEKGRAENNKVILFSSFRHTLAYLRTRLEEAGIRVGQIDGSTPDERRRSLTEAFRRPKASPEALDVLLFTEVGSEGLDYQFCDTMINYDLPWNPMRIEQRIGRIDRRGQRSEVVRIYNIITAGTVDADIYNRCLKRIGIFERSIGDCEAILGEISQGIEKIALSSTLSEEQRREKLEALAVQEIQRVKEIEALEEQQQALFGVDISAYLANNELRVADNRWVAPDALEALVRHYFVHALQSENPFIREQGVVKALRIFGKDRVALFRDFNNLRAGNSSRSITWEAWKSFLQGRSDTLPITFDVEVARANPSVALITAAHPLVRQAAAQDALATVALAHLQCVSDEVPPGDYPFRVCAWEYRGIVTRHRLRFFCENPALETILPEILFSSITATSGNENPGKDIWAALDRRAEQALREARARHETETEATKRYRLESIKYSFETRLNSLERLIADATNDSIKRMYRSEEEKLREGHPQAIANINATRADVYGQTIAQGILTVFKED